MGKRYIIVLHTMLLLKHLFSWQQVIFGEATDPSAISSLINNQPIKGTKSILPINLWVLIQYNLYAGQAITPYLVYHELIDLARALKVHRFKLHS